MANDMNRVLIETIVKKTLKDLKNSPERSTRNLVDMALHFSDGRFQRSFFETASTMLENPVSPYYDLIKDAAAHVDPERILTFGMNLGYNSCTVGAKKIRENESCCGFNIPWTISIALSEQRLNDDPECYSAVLTEGEDLGIYTWMLSYRGRLQDTLPLIQAHPDSAFILFCDPEDITPTFLDSIMEVKHLMLAIRFGEDLAPVCNTLRDRELLYSLYHIYGEEDADEVMCGDLFISAKQMHPIFTAVYPEETCPEETAASVYQAILKDRKAQTFQTVAWDLAHDTSYIDGIISDDSCTVFFAEDGRLHMPGKSYSLPLSLFEQSLRDILKQAFPKK
ncbi:MAG: hypothetical protein LUE29_00865 [Lachnospiraceae bacterium]|nr:hypothetical protein [Lachnospiraceae bacterium]